MIADPPRLDTDGAATVRRRGGLRPDQVKTLSLLVVIAAAIIVFGVVVDDYLSGRFVQPLAAVDLDHRARGSW